MSVMQLFLGFDAFPRLIHGWCSEDLQELGPGVMFKVCLAEVWIKMLHIHFFEAVEFPESWVKGLDMG